MGLGQTSTLSTVSSQVGSGLLALAPATGVAAPFVAAAGGVAELVGAVSKLFSGCGATCTEATSIVNQAEPYFQQLVTNYLGCPGRTTTDQQNYLAVFQQMWQQIVSACGNPALGSAGQNCINDRGPNGCTWKTTAGEMPIDGTTPYPTGTCWNWWVGYYDPIANDVPPGGNGPATSCSVALGGSYATEAQAAGAASSVASGISSILSGSSSDSSMLILAAVILLGAVLL
jgi:hypothetical protein